jgi:hypothetical protein
VSTTVTCPHCGRDIAPDEALSQRIRQQLQKETEAKLSRKRQALGQAESKVLQEKLRLDEQKKGLEAEMAARIAEERSKLKGELRKEMEETTGIELAALKGQIEEKEKKLETDRKSREEYGQNVRQRPGHYRSIPSRARSLRVEGTLGRGRGG